MSNPLPAAVERAAIVAWLREEAGEWRSLKAAEGYAYAYATAAGILMECADEIEQGSHLRTREQSQ